MSFRHWHSGFQTSCSYKVVPIRLPSKCSLWDGSCYTKSKRGRCQHIKKIEFSFQLPQSMVLKASQILMLCQTEVHLITRGCSITLSRVTIFCSCLQIRAYQCLQKILVICIYFLLAQQFTLNLLSVISSWDTAVRCGQLGFIRNSELGLSTNSTGINYLPSVYLEAVPIHTHTVFLAVAAYQITW